ncbi:MAG: ribose 5-phosphate isomerase B [Acidobacteria bacterium]|nr:ribose 5-phosphate isomerase B [Acidobacteriota bacterium]
MKIAIGADHAGFVLKESLKGKLIRDGHEVVDFGTDSQQSCDYPDFAQAVGRAVATGSFDRGVLVCSSGVGMVIAANKIDGVRAAPAQSDEEVRLTREHNDANVLTFGAKFVDEPSAARMLDIFLNGEFEGGRHARRLAKVAQLERKYDTGGRSGATNL